MNTSDLIHLGVFLLYGMVLFSVAGNIRVKKLRNFSSLIQLTVVLLCVDLLVGFFVIERAYGSSASAGWIMKAIYFVPVALIASVWWMLRAHKKARTTQDS